MTKLLMSESDITNIQTKHPSLRPTTIQKKHALYVDAVIQEVLLNFLWRDNYNSGANPGQLNKTKLDKQLGVFVVGKKSHKFLSLFEKFSPLYITSYVGNGLQHKISNAKFLIGIEDIMEYVDYSTLYRTFKEYFDRAKEQDLYSVTVDIPSLMGYIQKNKTYKETARTTEHHGYLDKRIRIAQFVLQVAEENNNSIPHFAETATSGRLYYKGLSLQTCPKEVRYAAMGHCYNMDMKAGSFALMLEMARDIYSLTDAEMEKAFGLLISYIKNRTVDRKSICHDVFGNCDKQNIKKVKASLTSIGFGAKNSASYRTAIGMTMGKPELAKAFLSHYMVKGIIRQFKLLKDSIWDFYKDNNVIQYDECEPYPSIQKKEKNKVLAHLYQSFEAHIMLYLIPALGDADPRMKLENKLYVHDGIVTTDSQTIQKVKDIEWQIQQAYPLVQFDVEEFNKWHYEVPMRDEEYEHKKLIAEQEQIAKTYVPAASILVPEANNKEALDEYYQAEAAKKGKAKLSVVKSYDELLAENEALKAFMEEHKKGQKQDAKILRSERWKK